MSRNEQHPDYPYELRQANEHTWYSPDIHGHHVYLRAPHRSRQEWSAQAVSHDGNDKYRFQLGPEGDPHTHMQHIWHELDPGVGWSIPEHARMQSMFDQVLRTGSARREEFEGQIRRTRGMN
jgi:hypothetical protein